MNTHSKLFEDFQYLKEVIFDKAREGEVFNYHLSNNRSIIAFPGIAGAWLKDGIKRYMKENSVKGEVVNWGFFLDGIENRKYFKIIDEKVKRYKNPTILAFSASSFTLILWAEKNKAWNRINKIITIGAPFKGIKIAKYLAFLNQTFKDISPESLLIERIKKIKPPNEKVLSIFGRKDEHTPNPKEILLNWPTIVVNTKSHGDLQNHISWIETYLI